MISLTTAIAYAFVAGILYFTYIIYYQYTYWKRRKMLHLGLIPILGHNAPLVLQTASFPKHAGNLYKKFPEARYFGMFDFKRPAVILRDPELIRKVCVKSFDDFVDHDAFLTEEMDPIIGRNLFSLRGQRWKEVRNTLTPSFTAARMKVLFELLAECSRSFVQYFVDHPEAAKSFEARNAFKRYASDIIATVAYGVKVDSMKDPNNEFYLHSTKSTTFTVLFVLKFHLLRNYSRLMRWAGLTFLPKSSDVFFKKLIAETVQTRREKGIIRQDMIHLMMQAMDKENGISVTVDDIVAQAFFFFLAGFDSMSSLMCCIAQELAANPDIQTKLQEEVDEWYEIDGDITYESLGKMKYLDMVVSETLRKYPNVSMTNRLCVKDHLFPPPMEGYPEYLMKKDTVITIPIVGLHHDPKYFPNPDKFDPERFSEENKSSIDPYTYLPFGHGPRQCIGNRFALMEAKIVIVNVLRKFSIRFTEKSRHPIIFAKRSFIMDAEGGFWLKFEERKKSN